MSFGAERPRLHWYSPAVRVLVVRHHEEDSPGLVADAFSARGAEIDVRLYPEDGPLPEARNFDHTIVLGSKWSVYDRSAVGEWLDGELDWLRRADADGVPVFGICFGAQLLTSALGGTVERSPVHEVGWLEIEPVEAPAAGVRIGRGPWFEFHGDRCLLPPTAVLLARTDVCVQAFTIGRNLGVQFHPEIDADQLVQWYDQGGREEVTAVGRDPDALLAETATEEKKARLRAAELVDAYLAHASGSWRL